MPLVPTSNVVPMQRGEAPRPPIDPTYLAMAAATMHEQGRLFEPAGVTLDYAGRGTMNDDITRGQELRERHDYTKPSRRHLEEEEQQMEKRQRLLDRINPTEEHSKAREQDI